MDTPSSIMDAVSVLHGDGWFFTTPPKFTGYLCLICFSSFSVDHSMGVFSVNAPVRNNAQEQPLLDNAESKSAKAQRPTAAGQSRLVPVCQYKLGSQTWIKARYLCSQCLRRLAAFEPLELLDIQLSERSDPSLLVVVNLGISSCLGLAGLLRSTRSAQVQGVLSQYKLSSRSVARTSIAHHVAIPSPYVYSRIHSGERRHYCLPQLHDFNFGVHFYEKAPRADFCDGVNAFAAAWLTSTVIPWLSHSTSNTAGNSEAKLSLTGQRKLSTRPILTIQRHFLTMSVNVPTYIDDITFFSLCVSPVELVMNGIWP
ncbi:hypothetical protein K474DRAFT_1680275 [Panus rudis PR-1116 ss-1]|nr:hypothetical protein K474DRAFT_1680275 [Panus rudis PR-1116 ss-1]